MQLQLKTEIAVGSEPYNLYSLHFRAVRRLVF